MTISAIVEISVNIESSDSYKLNATRAGMHHVGYLPCERH